jgi:hypothetical protein
MRTKKAFDLTTGKEIQPGDLSLAYRPNATPRMVCRASLVCIISETAVEIAVEGRFAHCIVHPSQINARVEIAETPEFTWKKVTDTSLHNLWVCSRGNVEVGFIEKPLDTRTEKNAWRAYRGIGENNQFLGHRSSRGGAQLAVEHSLK